MMHRQPPHKIFLDIWKHTIIKEIIALLVFVIVIFGLVQISDTHVETILKLQILPGPLTIGSTGSLDLGNYTALNIGQSVSGTFGDYFWVEDLRGADVGYYTTMQLEGDFVGSGSARISRKQAYIKVPSLIPDAIEGNTNPNVVIQTGFDDWLSLDSPRTFIKRDTAENYGIVGKYGEYPELQIRIPAYQPADNYVGKLVYTLYEN